MLFNARHKQKMVFLRNLYKCRRYIRKGKETTFWINGEFAHEKL